MHFQSPFAFFPPLKWGISPKKRLGWWKGYLVFFLIFFGQMVFQKTTSKANPIYYSPNSLRAQAHKKIIFKKRSPCIKFQPITFGQTLTHIFFMFGSFEKANTKNYLNLVFLNKPPNHHRHWGKKLQPQTPRKMPKPHKGGKNHPPQLILK